MERPREETLTVVEAARVLRVCKQTVYNQISQGQLPSIRVGRLLRIPRSRLECLLAGRPIVAGLSE